MNEDQQALLKRLERLAIILRIELKRTGSHMEHSATEMLNLIDLMKRS
jgi:hypothetical protein